MTRQTVAAYCAGQPMAVAMDHAAGLMGMAMPEVGFDAQAQLQAQMLEPGERYVLRRDTGVLPLRGMITPNAYLLERYLGWTTCHGFEQSLAELVASEDVARIVVPVDSPGGLVVGVQGAADALRAAAQVKPVHALVHPLAASAAYWIASGATEITLTPGSVVGSIGVAREASAAVSPDMMGRQASVHLSSHARAKIPDPTSEAGRAELQRGLDMAEADFHAAVAAGRGMSVDDLLSRASATGAPEDGGAVWFGAEAQARGLVDRLETAQAFWDRMAAASGPARPVTATQHGRRAQRAAAVARAQAAL